MIHYSCQVIYFTRKELIILRMLPFFKPKKGFMIAGGGGGGSDTSALANKTDLTAIILTGTTNTSGDVITADTWFYLNGTPCVAKVDIASGATFTKDTNYEEKTIGSALSELNSNSIGTRSLISENTAVGVGNPFVCPTDGYLSVYSGTSAGDYYRVDILGPTGTGNVVPHLSACGDGHYNLISCYVRKGMCIRFSEKNSSNVSGDAYFYPIV